MEDTAFEKHYTIIELTKLWSCGIETVRRKVLREIAQQESGVPSQKLDCLYQALVAITDAINELEEGEAQ